MGQESESPDPQVKKRFPNPDSQWKPGQSGNPRGRPSNRQKFDHMLTTAALERAPEIIAKLLEGALEGDQQQMRTLINKLVANVTKHEIDAGAAPSKLVIEFSKPEPGNGGEGGDAG